MLPLQISTVVIPTLVFVFFWGGEQSLLKVPCGRVHCHDRKVTWLAKDMVIFYACSTMNIPKFED
jgi:hypothetical protein